MGSFTKAVLICLVAVAIFAIAPMVTLWVINSLAEAGGAEFYIPHTPWNYLLTIVLLVIINANSANKS